MRIENLELKNFRNYHNLKIEFADNINIIIGNNAQGKTNILEAIYYLSITKSFLPVNDITVINKDNENCFIKAKIKNNKNNKKIFIGIGKNDKKLKINDKEIKKHFEFIGNLKVIIYNPDNIRIIKDSPSVRRKFLNVEISQLYNKYIVILNEYNAILKQRNEYLKLVKKGYNNDIYFDILNDKYITLAIKIYIYRNNFINSINKYLNEIFFSIANEENLSLKYISNIEIDEPDKMKINFLNKLKEQYEKEILYGTSLLGPHRDDFSFKLKDNDLIMYGSQGQKKMAVLALKLSEVKVFYDICGEYPVLLLDDLFSELDIEKRNMVINYLNFDIQTIITTTDILNINNDFLNKANIYKIENGNVI